VAAPDCGRAGPAPRYDHVLWIWMENEAYGSVIGSSGAPYLNSLAARCGLATEYRAVSHPSLPNYLAMTGGSTFGVTDDGDPSVRPISGPSIYAQVQAAGKRWRAYNESMPAPCERGSAGLYAARHNPATYFVTLRGACPSQDLALGPVAAGALARDLAGPGASSFITVTPNLCHDMHDCPVGDGDRWLAGFLPSVLASPTYQAGHTVVFITWDEGVGANQVPTLVVGPSVPPGTRARQAFNHYSLLATTEDLLGLARLGQAAGARSMAGAFHL
jgi:hypothetical protein